MTLREHLEAIRDRCIYGHENAISEHVEAALAILDAAAQENAFSADQLRLVPDPDAAA